MIHNNTTSSIRYNMVWRWCPSVEYTQKCITSSYVTDFVNLHFLVHLCMYLVAFTGHLWTFSPWESSLNCSEEAKALTLFAHYLPLLWLDHKRNLQHLVQYCKGLKWHRVWEECGNTRLGLGESRGLSGNCKGMCKKLWSGTICWGTEVSSLHVDVLDIRDKCCSKLGGKMTAANSRCRWRSKSVGAAALSLVGQSKESALKIRKDQGKNCRRAGVTMNNK